MHLCECRATTVPHALWRFIERTWRKFKQLWHFSEKTEQSMILFGLQKSSTQMHLVNILLKRQWYLCTVKKYLPQSCRCEFIRSPSSLFRDINIACIHTATSSHQDPNAAKNITWINNGMHIQKKRNAPLVLKNANVDIECKEFCFLAFTKSCQKIGQLMIF